MKVLISSSACSPYSGSEAAYGWRACRALAEEHELWILVEIYYREELERARAEGLIPANMHFYFFGELRPFHSNRLRARIDGWADYIHFQKRILSFARELHREIGFDLAHLVTYTTWRVACPLWQLGLPLVWGPISGTEMFPLQFLGILSWSARAFELARMAQSWIAWYSPSVRACCREAACIPATHRQAYDWISRLRGHSEGVSVFCNVFFADQYIAELRRPWPAAPPAGPLKIFASGNLEGRKGVALALRALAQAKAQGVPFTYRVTSGGPELAHLERLRDRLGLSAEVELGAILPRPEFLAELRASDVYLLPSLREGAGQTMMEAMLAGCVPVVAHWGGPAEIVTDESGYRVPVTNVERMTAGLCDVLVHLDRNRHLLLEKGRAAERRIAENYNALTYRRTINAAYAAAVASHQPKKAEG